MPDSKDKQTPVATAGVAAAQAKLSAAQSAVPNLAAPRPGLPVVPRELDWVRLEQRFPVRIKLSKNVPAGFLRIGSSMEKQRP